MFFAGHLCKCLILASSEGARAFNNARLVFSKKFLLFHSTVGEALNPVFEFAEFAGAVFVTAAGVSQMIAENPEDLVELLQFDLQRFNFAQHRFCALTDAQAVQPHHDGLQVGVERVGRDRNHPFLNAVLVEVVSVLIADDCLVVNVLRRDVHQGKGQRAIGGADVLARDLIDAPAHVLEKLAAGGLAAVLGISLSNAPEVLQRKLGVDGHHALGKEQDCVGGVAAGEAILHGVVLARKNFARSEEHTSELQSLRHLVCRLLLEKKKKTTKPKRGSTHSPSAAPITRATGSTTWSKSAKPL